MEEDFVNKSKIYPWYFAAGAIFYLYGPVRYSRDHWNRLFFYRLVCISKELNFVGFQNFIDVFSGDQDYLQYILNTLLFTVVTTAAKTGLGLLFALALQQEY